jgi:hypothetical protein
MLADGSAEELELLVEAVARGAPCWRLGRARRQRHQRRELGPGSG